MRKKNRKWPKIAAMVLITTILTGSVALVLVEKFAPDQTMIPQSIVSLPSTIVAVAVKPFQGAFAWATNGISGYLANWKLLKNIEIEYNKIKSQNDEYIYEAMRNKELEIEIEQLRELLDASTSAQYASMTPIMATVTEKETGNWFQMFTINVGSRDGVKQNMAVVNTDGLIGYISTVKETTSQVISIVDSRASVAGIIQSSRDQGTIRGTLGIEDEAVCRMYYLPVDITPRPGDEVVTSGIGLPFPKGIKIGVIRESTRHMDENKHYVVIEPAVDFMHIENVLVLIYEPNQEEMPDADDGQINYIGVDLDTPRPYPSTSQNLTDPNINSVTAPPRVTRSPGDTIYEDGTLAPGATMTPNPEMDELMRQEQAAEGGT